MKSHRKISQKKARRSAFTLLELLIVLAIIVSIAAMVAPTLLTNQQEANVSTTIGQIKTIEDAVKRRAVKNNGVYDDSLNIADLASSWEDNRGQEHPPLLEEVPKDPWGNDFQYAYDSGNDIKPRITSNGPDGQPGTDDDISTIRDDSDS